MHTKLTPAVSDPQDKDTTLNGLYSLVRDVTFEVANKSEGGRDDGSRSALVSTILSKVGRSFWMSRA